MPKDETSRKTIDQEENERVEKYLDLFLNDFRNQVDIASLTNEQLVQMIEQKVCEQTPYQSQPLSIQARLIDRIYSSIRGYDVLDEFLDDPEVTEIMVNAF